MIMNVHACEWIPGVSPSNVLKCRRRLAEVSRTTKVTMSFPGGGDHLCPPSGAPRLQTWHVCAVCPRSREGGSPPPAHPPTHAPSKDVSKDVGIKKFMKDFTLVVGFQKVYEGFHVYRWLNKKFMKDSTFTYNKSINLWRISRLQMIK